MILTLTGINIVGMSMILDLDTLLYMYKLQFIFSEPFNFQEIIRYLSKDSISMEFQIVSIFIELFDFLPKLFPI